MAVVWVRQRVNADVLLQGCQSQACIKLPMPNQPQPMGKELEVMTYLLKLMQRAADTTEKKHFELLTEVMGCLSFI